MTQIHPQYDDHYATCIETYATLRIYPNESPETVTTQLGISPTRVQEKGDRSKTGVPFTTHGWFLCSRNFCSSRDIRRHLDWILEKITSKRNVIQLLCGDGTKADISCYWLSAHGHGGPTLSPIQMAQLATLNLDCWFDIYFAKNTTAK